MLKIINALCAFPKIDGWDFATGPFFVDHGTIRKSAPENGETRILDARGAVVLPGLVNAHHHIYSRLAKGLPVVGPMRSFPEVLSSLWWTLDRALDPDAVRLSTVLTLRECIRHGVTTIFDHHSSPQCSEGILETMAGIYRNLSLRGALCLEVTGRNGKEAFESALTENLAFHGDNDVRPMLGLHAGFTLSDEQLRKVAEHSTSLPVHIHLAESTDDANYAAKLGASPVSRLERFGLLRRDSLLIHGNYLDDDDLDRLSTYPVFLVQNLESALNNLLVPADPNRFLRRGLRLIAGTDGMHSNMFRAWKDTFLWQRGQLRAPDAGFYELDSLIRNSYTLKERYGFGCGLRPGEVADFVITDYIPGMNLTPENWPGHLLYGLVEANARHVIRGERVLLEDYHLAPDPFDELVARQSEIVSNLVRGFTNIATGKENS